MRSFDGDGNGVLDLKELRRLMVKMGMPKACHSLDFAKDLFNEVDGDDSGRISYMELAQALEAVNTDTGFKKPSPSPKERVEWEAEMAKGRRKAEEGSARDAFEAISMDHVIEPIR